MDLLGTIVRLQVQRSSLKLGSRPRRWFDPTPLTAVPALSVGERGVLGLPQPGDPIVDVHNRDHPHSHNSGRNGISVGFTSHYAALRSRFGEWVSLGIAGENLIVQSQRAFRTDDLPPALIVETADGPLRLEDMHAINPCLEFSRFILGYGVPPDVAILDSTTPDPAVTETLAFLTRGTRGYAGTFAGGATTLRVGDRLYIA